MSMVRCPTCGKKIDNSFYGACLDCGTLLPTEETPAPTAPRAPTQAPPPASTVPPSRPGDAPGSVDDHIARYEARSTGEKQMGSTPVQESRGRGGRIATGLLIRLGIVGVILSGGAIWGFFFNADRDDSGAIVDSGNLTPDQLRVGDCLDWPGSDSDEIETFDSVNALPCGQPHDLEVYHLAAYPAGSGETFPGNDPIIEYGYAACFDAFTGYVGAPWEEVADVDITLFWPSEESWSDGDRTIHCLLMPYVEGEKLMGSLQGRDA